ncbi:MAG: hypothetical protein SGI94_21430 [Saprospiraceae bacterium]|nr:hypothetical protein [Saprospiraceae bacterium]
MIRKNYLLQESQAGKLEKLDPLRFMRIHRPVVIHTGFLNEINNIGLGDVEVRRKDGLTFRASKSYEEEWHRKLGLG